MTSGGAPDEDCPAASCSGSGLHHCFRAIWTWGLLLVPSNQNTITYAKNPPGGHCCNTVKHFRTCNSLKHILVSRRSAECHSAKLNWGWPWRGPSSSNQIPCNPVKVLVHVQLIFLKYKAQSHRAEKAQSGLLHPTPPGA